MKPFRSTGDAKIWWKYHTTFTNGHAECAGCCVLIEIPAEGVAVKGAEFYWGEFAGWVMRWV